MKKYDTAAIIWPSYTPDEGRTKIFWEQGEGEWQTVKSATREKDGENWPRRPLWGYVNEADPYVMESQIEAATDHGINVFIYDWYWYDGRPFLENCLNDGFLKAKNNEKMKFYLMWANHDATYLWDVRNSDDLTVPVWRGAQPRDEFEKIAKRLTEKYFTLPNYYKIDNKPVFMLYDIENLVEGLGGFDETKAALAWFDDYVKAFGFDGMHFQHVKFGEYLSKLCKSDGRDMTVTEALKELGYSSMSHYQFAHFMPMSDMDYPTAIENMKKEWEECSKGELIYFPHVSLGWDANPRFKKYDPNVLKDNTPENVEKAFRLAKEYADKHSENPPLIIINSWNEWTEGSYFEPDDKYGYGYLEAAKRIFK